MYRGHANAVELVEAVSKVVEILESGLKTLR